MSSRGLRARTVSTGRAAARTTWCVFATRLQGAAFAVAPELVLVDGRVERLEGRFLRRLAADLGLERQTAKSIVDVIRLKNSA